MSGIAGSTGDANGSLDSALKATSDLGSAGSAMAKGMNPYLAAHDAAIGLHEDEIGRLATYKNTLTSMISELERKNKVHDQELGLVTDEVNMVDQLSSGFGDVADNVVDGEKALAKVKQTMMAIWATIQQVDAATENFVTTNYRAYGSMQELANEARYLQSELGVTNEVAMSTIQALSNVKTPIEQMDKYAKVVAKANRTTGVATDTLAGYTLYLRNLGINAEGAEKQIEFMTDAMRKYGLTTNDVNMLMSRSGMQALNMARLFGGSAEELAKFEKTRIGMAAVSKEIGITAGELEGFYNHLSDNVGAMQQFGALSGTVINSADDFNVALIKGGMALDRQLASLEARAAAGDEFAAQELIAAEKALANAHFGGSVAALRSARQMSKLAKEMNLAGDSADDFRKIMEATKAKAMDPFDEANQSLTAQLRILKETISGTLMPFIQMMADGLMYVVMAINMVLKPILYVIKLFGQFLELLGKIPVLGAVLKFIVGLGVALVLLVGAMIAFGVAVTGFAVSVGFFGKVIAGARTLVISFAKMMVTVARAIGKSIVILLKSLGEGLAALGKAVQGVLPQLIGLAFALLLVGAGMYLLGLGVSLVAEQGWMAVAAMFAMVAAMIVAIAALAIIATIAAPVVPLIVALAFAVLLLGAAAMMAGVGFYLIGQSIEAVATYGIEAAIAIAALIVPVLGLGLAGLVAAPGLMLLGIAMMMIAVPAYILAMSFSILVRAMDMFIKFMPKLGAAGEALVYFAAMVLSAVAILFVAGLLMIPAALALIVGSVLLTMAGIAMFVAGLSLAVGGAVLAIGAAVVAIAAVILVPAAMGIFFAGLLLLTGGFMMLMGATFMLASAPVLIAASAALIAAAFTLYVALAIFTPAVAVAVYVGALLVYAGIALLVGATLILYAAQILYVGSVIMQISAVLFDEAMQLLLPAAQLSVIAGYYLLIGAVQIISAAAMLAIAGVLLFYSAVLIMVAAVMLVPASILLGFASLLLIVASVYLTIAAVEALHWWSYNAWCSNVAILCWCDVDTGCHVVNNWHVLIVIRDLRLFGNGWLDIHGRHWHEAARTGLYNAS
jgi:hypothetical protein